LSTGDFAILHTTDGGETWDVFPIEQEINCVGMATSTRGYVGGNGGLMYETHNGLTWEYMFQPLTQNIFDIAFPQGNDPMATGYAVGGGAGEPSMLASISPDEIKEIETPWYGEWQSISVASPEILWITGNNEVTRWNTTTSEGTLNNPAGVTTSYLSLSFINENEGWVAENWNVYHTADGGNSWDQQTDTSGILTLLSIDFLDNLHGWVVGSIGLIKTTDGGQNWNQETIPVDPQENWLHKVQFTSLHNGYIIGANKTLLKYTMITGIEEIKVADVEVYPNPTRGVVGIQSLVVGQRSVNVKITDLYGNVLAITPCQLPAANCQLDISHLPAGVYFLRINLENRMIVKKIVKL
jgi:photosystem II stability/assembly factor-like uncharacterized protein